VLEADVWLPPCGGLEQAGIANYFCRCSRLRAALRAFTDMGDKSPKTKNKQAAQKQAKANAAARQKNDNRAAKQTVKPNR
jgi:hypothetical protein